MKFKVVSVNTLSLETAGKIICTIHGPDNLQVTVNVKVDKDKFGSMTQDEIADYIIEDAKRQVSEAEH